MYHGNTLAPLKASYRLIGEEADFKQYAVLCFAEITGLRADDHYEGAHRACCRGSELADCSLPEMNNRDMLHLH